MKLEIILTTLRLTLPGIFIPVLGISSGLLGILYAVWCGLPIVETFSRKRYRVWGIVVSLLSALWIVFTVYIGIRNKAGSPSAQDWILVGGYFLFLYLTPVFEYLYARSHSQKI